MSLTHDFIGLAAFRVRSTRFTTAAGRALGMHHQLHGAIALPDGALHLLVSFFRVAPVVHPERPWPGEDRRILQGGPVVERVRTGKRPALDDVQGRTVEGADLVEPGLLVVVG